MAAAHPPITRRVLLAASASGTALFLVGCGSAGGLGLGVGTAATAGMAGTPDMAYSPSVLAAGPGGTLYEVDTVGHRVAEILPDGSYGWETEPGTLNGPQDAAVDASGHVCVASRGDDVILVYDGQGSLVTEVGRHGSGSGEFNSIRDLAFDENDLLYVVDAHNHRVQVLNGLGAVIRTFGEPGNDAGQFNCPRALAFDSQGDVHVLDAGNWRVQVFDPAGAFLREYGYYGDAADEFLMPTDLTIDGEDRVYVVDPAMRRILVFENAGHGAPSVIEPVDEAGVAMVPLRIALTAGGDLLLTAYAPDVPAPTL